MYFKHDSWDEFYKSPFGAAEIGQEVTFRVRSNETVNINLHTRFRDNDNYYPMIQSPDDPEVFEVTIPMPASTGLLWYDFHFDAFNAHYIYGAPPDGFGGEGQVNLFSDQSYQITVYSPERKVPEWFKEGVIYQIFPDRFNHGDREGFTPVYPNHTILHTNWTDKPHYFRKPDGSIDYYDFFGGNLQGIIDKLDYLQDLGITIIYLNPIFQSCSNHKYDTADYKTIAPEFGNLEIFEELCEEAKKRGIRIILDGVFNHTGDDSRYFNKYNVYPELGAYQDKQSPYYSWYNFINHPDEYESWWGIKSMPSTNKNNDNLKHFIFSGDDSVIRYWIRKGASGWRLDVADELNDEFIVGIKESLMSENPDAVLIGEVWEDASNKISYGKLRDYLLGKELDSTMNYPFRLCMIDFFKGFRSSDQVMRQLMSLYEHYPLENFMSAMNLIGSHDRRRIITALANIPTHNEMSELDRENFSLSVEDYYLSKKRLMLAMLIQMTFPGVPSIYYGDETGMQGFEDPYNRGSMNWDNIDQEIFQWYKELIKLRNNSDILKKGDFKPVFGPEDIFAFTRSYNGTTYLIAVNRNPYNAQSFSYPEEGRMAKNLFTGELKTLDQINVSPFGYVLFELLKEKKNKMYKLIATDLDETLISQDHTITEKNKEAIKKAIDKGVKFVLATGRGYETVQNTLKDLDLNDREGEYVISFNGGALTENKDTKVLELIPLKRELAEEIFKQGKKYGNCIHVYTKDTVYCFNMTDEERKYLDGRMEVVETDEENLDFIKDDIVKLLFVNTDFEYLKSIEKDLSYLKDDTDISYSAGRYIEFNPKGITKGKGLIDLCNLIGIDIKDTIAVGDNFNDLPMIQAAGLGVGVANTNEEMKELCDVITDNDYNHSAIAEVIEKYILNDN